MSRAPRDGTIVDLRHVSKAYGEVVFRARWLEPVREWVDWDRQHVALSKVHLKGWRTSAEQFRQWTPEEVATLADIHGDEGVSYLDPVAWQAGARVVVPGPVTAHG